MLRRLAITLATATIAAGCGEAAAPDESASSTFHAPSGLLSYSGNSDESGHVMLPAGAHAACEVHGAPLADDVIAVLRGLPYIDASGYSEVQRTRFPHDATLFYGGCGGGRMWVAVSYCPACREAELLWEQSSAAAGRPYAYDAEMRSRIRANAETMTPEPALPAR